MLNWKEPSIYIESITKVRLCRFHTHTHTNPILSSLCNRKHWIGLHYKRKELCIVTSKKTRLNCSSYQQRALHCYIEKDTTEPFPIPTGWTVSHLKKEIGVVTLKKTKLNRSPSQQRPPTSLTFMILSKINQPFPPRRFLDASMSPKIVCQTTHTNRRRIQS